MRQIKNGLWFDDEFPFYNFVTTRSFGNMREQGIRNKLFLEKSIEPKSVISAHQIHSNKVVAVNNSHQGKEIPQADGLITSDKNLSLIIFTADCLPIFFACKEKKVVGLVHAGWRGLASGIISEVVATFNKEFNIKPEKIFASIGPGIQKCCYEVSDDVRTIFGISQKEKNIDLPEIAVKQLKENGISSISVNKYCTFHKKDLFFSYRREKTQNRMMSIVNLGNVKSALKNLKY